MNALAARLRWRGDPSSDPAAAGWFDGALGGPAVMALADGMGAVAARAPESAALAEAGLAQDARLGLVVAWLGRLDAREELGRAAGVATGAGTDAELVLAAYAAAGDRVFDRIVGPFAALVVDLRRRTVVLARDPLGGRPLFLRRSPDELAVASRPSALLAPGASSPAALDERAVAAFLSIGGPPAGVSFFRGVEELPPGAVLTVAAEGRCSVRRIALTAEAAPGRGGESDYEARFRDLLDAAVACRLPRSGRTAVLMSGGLDSTSVAATAARQIATRGGPRPLTLSWIFDELEGIDERRWIEAANRASGAEGRLLAADSFWPLAGGDAWPRLVETPAAGPFALARRRAFEAAAAAGCEVVLTGEAADDLWWNGVEWLRSLLAAGRAGEAVAAATRLAFRGLRDPSARQALRAALARLRRPPGYLPRRRDWPWLTAPGREIVAAAEAGAGGDPLWREFAEPAHPLVFPFDLTLLRAAEEESSACGVAIRRPYRDRRMVEFFLGVPPRYLYRPGERKRLLRRALVDRLPPEVLGRRERTTLLALYRRGFAGGARERIDALLGDGEALWPRFVDRHWLETTGWREAESGDGAAALVLWHCVALELWRRVWNSPVAEGRASG